MKNHKYNITFILGLLLIVLLSPAEADKNFFIISPVYGWHHNAIANDYFSSSDNGYQTGLFTLSKYKNFIFNIYPFYVRANHSNIKGLLFYSNYYLPIKDSNFSVNLGIGNIYHKIVSNIELPYMSTGMPPTVANIRNKMETTINIPLPKIGFRYKKKNFKINPYYCRIRESNKISVPEVTAMISLVPSVNKRKYYNLYGINIEYVYHHFWSNTLKYYFNDRTNDKDTFTFRLRSYLSLNKKFGFLLRYEYDEHTNGIDKSVLLGPFVMF